MLPFIISEVRCDDNAPLPFGTTKCLPRATLAIGGREPTPAMYDCPVISTGALLINHRANRYTTDMEISDDTPEIAIVDNVSPGM